MKSNGLYLLLLIVKDVQQLYITNKTECFSSISGCAMQHLKLIKEDWPKVLQ